MDQIYLDNAATTPLHPQVRKTIAAALEEYFANPSSLHSLGLAVEEQLDKARSEVADLLAVDSNRIFFTSGGTEANNLAIQGSNIRGRLLVSAVEHPSVREVFRHLEQQGHDVRWLAVDNRGVVDLNGLEHALDKPVQFVSVMAVNNETGSIQPLEQICRLVRAQSPDAIIHVDAVQALGKVAFAPETLGADLVSISSHKIHGPKGVGALYVSRPRLLHPLFMGGGQEGNLRSGTENTVGIIGFGAAAAVWHKQREQWQQGLAEMRARFVAGLTRLGAQIISPPDGSSHILAASFPGHRGQVLLQALSERGVFVSTGAACSGKKGNLSYVAEAMALGDEVIRGMLRFSFSPLNTGDELDRALVALAEVLQELAFIRGRRSRK